MDADTFKRMFLPCHKKYFRIALRFVENKADAEDMVQETYVKLWQKRNNLEIIENADSFAITVLKNTCLDFLKRAKPEMLQIYDENLSSSNSLSVNIENKDKLKHVQDILNRLPFQQKLLIQLRHWDNLSDEEIENVTGLTRGNIKVSISRARKTIKELFQKLEK